MLAASLPASASVGGTNLPVLRYPPRMVPLPLPDGRVTLVPVLGEAT